MLHVAEVMKALLLLLGVSGVLALLPRVAAVHLVSLGLAAALTSLLSYSRL